MSRKDVYRALRSKGHTGSQSMAYEYMNKLIRCHNIEVSIYKSSSLEVIQKKRLEKYDHLTRNGVFRYLWMGAELTLHHKEYIFSKYPVLKELYLCIREFRQIFEKRSMPRLYLFIEKYQNSEWKDIAKFVKGLEKDLSAVENAVASDLSNGFVEGTNNKLKMVKRIMYGRCSKELLAAKMMYA